MNHSFELYVRDTETRELLPCWVTLRDPKGNVLLDWAVHPELPGFPSDGTLSLSLPSGDIRITARRWLSHACQERVVRIPAGGPVEILLTPRLDPAALGWHCADSHNHLSAPITLEQVTEFCAALEMHVVELCQSWTLDPEPNRDIRGTEIATHLRAASTSLVKLDFGIERPKKRFGHWSWVGAPPPSEPLFVNYESWHDAAFCQWIARQPQPACEVQENCPFEGQLPFEYVRELRRSGAAAIAPHPTSWWWESDPPTFVSNLALDAIYCLLGGESPDGLVVMGYDADQIFYQNLWFRLLNEGFNITGCAETDASLRGKHYLGHLRQYLRIEGAPDDRKARAEAVRKGRVLVTSGPFVEFSADEGKFGSGDRVRMKPEGHTLDVRLWSAADPSEGIGCFVIYRNGRPYHVESFPEDRPRYLERTLRVAGEGERAWYVVKVYGAHFPRRPEFLDVMAYAELCEHEPHEEYKEFTKVALTNPIYFEPPGWHPPAALECEVTLRVVERGTGRALPGVGIHWGEGAIRCDDQGRAKCRSSLLAVFELEKSGYRSRSVSLFLDYLPLRRCLEYGFTGQWLFESPNCLRPGQVPWRVFGFDALRSAAKQVDWTIELEPLDQTHGISG